VVSNNFNRRLDIGEQAVLSLALQQKH